MQDNNNNNNGGPQIPSNGWGEWRYYVLEKLKDQQKTIEDLRKENSDLQLSMELMREKKLEQRHEELKKKVISLKEAADSMQETVDAMQQERRERSKNSRRLWLAIIQGFVGLVLGLLSFLENGCSNTRSADRQVPVNERSK